MINFFKAKWIKNSEGKDDALLTMAWITFQIVIALYLLDVLSPALNINISFNMDDAVNLLDMLVLGYFFRRAWSEGRELYQTKIEKTLPKKEKEEVLPNKE